MKKRVERGEKQENDIKSETKEKNKRKVTKRDVKQRKQGWKRPEKET